MSLQDIKELPVDDVTAPNAHLYLWVPNALLPDGLDVMKAWGFRYVSNLVWAKRRKDGGPDGRGVGFYFRNTTELILFGVKGSMRTLPPARRQVNIIETRKREHSRKPDEQYALIEDCSPGPRLEMFARHPHPGWTVWGDESDPETTPRGIVHRGYAGGSIELKPHERLTSRTRKALGQQLRSEYELGASLKDLVDQHGLTESRVRGLLQEAGTVLRRRGRARTAAPEEAI